MRTMIVGVIVMTVGHMVSVGVMAVARRRGRMAVAWRRRMAVGIVAWHAVSVSRASICIVASVTMGPIAWRAMTVIVGMRSVAWRRGRMAVARRRRWRRWRAIAVTVIMGMRSVARRRRAIARRWRAVAWRWRWWTVAMIMRAVAMRIVAWRRGW